jgi:hypothetical protein
MSMTAENTVRKCWRTAALLVAASTILLACSGDSDSPVSSLDPSQGGDSRPALTAPPAEEPAPEEPPAEEPAPEEPPAEEPAPEESPAEELPAEEPADEPLTTEEWVLVILVGLLVLGAITSMVVLFSRRSGNQASDGGANQRRLDDITRSCRSIHDSSVLTLLQTSDPVMLRSAWGAASQQLVGLETQISYLVPELSGTADLRPVQELGVAVAGVRGALESNVGLRLDTQMPDQTDVIEASNRTVLYRSEQLESALQQVLYVRL